MCGKELTNFIKNSLKEDIKSGDLTSLATISKDAKKKATLISKSTGIIAGIELAEKIFKFIDSNIKFHKYFNDGDKVKYGDIIFNIYGNAISILSAERLVLNCMQKMSAISSKTSLLKSILQTTKTTILDTRKTAPLNRIIEKWAVRIGGGENHRLGLFDMIMIKDNHIDFNKDLKTTVNKAIQFKKQNNLNVKIIVEVRTINDIIEILNLSGFDRIVLDNFNIEDTNEAVKLINKKYPIESSGGINEHNILSYAKCGVNYISIGDLTHSIQNFDLSLTATK